jgi:hypothetical protein
MLAVLNFISTKVVIVVENLVYILSPRGDYHACEVSLCKVVTTVPNEPLVELGTQEG